MDPDNNSSPPPNLRPLHIQLPHRCPPMEAPPFQPATLRKCIRTVVRIQNHDKPQQALILTSVNCSVEEMLNVDPKDKDEDEELNHQLMEDDDNSFSDFSSDTSSSSFDDESDDDDDDDMDEDSSVGNDNDEGAAEVEVMMSQDNNNNCSNNGNTGTGDNRNNGNNGMQQMQCTQESSRLKPKPNHNKEVFRMKAFWLRRSLCENRHGVFTTYIYYAKVLEKADYDWIDTGEEVAIKVNSWQCIRASRNTLSEDFVKEIAALQYIRQYQETNMPVGTTHVDTHVLTADMVMSDESNLYIVMPYCAGGDLCQRVAMRREERLSEDEAREWFKQILKGIETLQQMQICHKDLSPENMIILENNSLVIDFGMCLRIPYSADGMHLFPPMTPCGKLPHMSPELYLKKPFDGHAVDIWAAGTILLFMLTGKRLQNPPLIDRAFDRVDLGVSHEAMDLLKKMFRLDPENRLSLEQIRNHPFVRCQFLCQR